jgi:hypothetical protein
MRPTLTHLSLLALLLCGLPSVAQAPPPSALSPKLDRLLVHGEGFVFGVKEPAGWQGDTGKAELYQANILFHRPATDPGKPEGVIRVRVSSKENENTEADLEADMDGYRRQFPRVQFPSLTAAHPSYRALAREFTVPGKFHEYVAYVNPGPRFHYLFSVALNTGSAPATEAELAALRDVIGSLAAIAEK